ncbi:MAG: lyase family protein, partial [Actinomycetota bacterium]|nr:lyase family protein [Actinomycetota bacterium]
MSRFSEPQDPVFRRLNTSLSFDRRLWPHDIAQSRAHVRMLAQQGIIDEAEREDLLGALETVAAELAADAFDFRSDDEDIHTAIERRVTEVAGAVGGKLHTARSRNDQVATDVAMYTRWWAEVHVASLEHLCRALLAAAERHLDWPLPGYTH